MENNTTGNNNIALGMDALNQNITGGANAAIGYKSLYNNTGGLYNIAIGEEALLNNTTNHNNTSIGVQSLINSTGNGNTAIGHQAGSNVSSGGNNTLIGKGANPGSGSYSNSTAIGYNATVTSSNAIQLGNSFTEVYHYGTLNSASDRRLKEDIRETKYGLKSLLKLNPVDYRLKASGNNQIGFIAQELMEIIPEAVSGKEGDLEKGEILSVSYTSLIPILTKAIQEQQQQLEAQQILIQSLLERLETLENK